MSLVGYSLQWRGYKNVWTKEFLVYNQTNPMLLIEFQVLFMHRNHCQLVRYGKLMCSHLPNRNRSNIGQSRIVILFENIKVHGQNSNYCNMQAHCVCMAITMWSKIVHVNIDIMLKKIQNSKINMQTYYPKHSG